MKSLRIGTIFFFFALLQVHAEEKKHTICLNMIVKNETKVIRRSLASAKRLIDYWVIVDTGSTDGTQEMIREFMKEIPGELHEREWVDFAHNRNEALQLAKNKGEYVLFIDADEEFTYVEDFVRPYLEKDFYYININHGGSLYKRTHLIKNAYDWKWVGVVHEYIGSPMATTSGTLEGVVNIYRSEGARSSDPEKYKKDARALEKALVTEPENSRNVFYLAQSYRDAGEKELALENYQKRAEMGGWDQEVFWSKYQIGVLQEDLKKDPIAIIQSYTEAFQYRPTRAEPLYRLAHFFRDQSNYLMGYLVASHAASLPRPNDILFVETWVYEYGLLMERSVCAYWIEKYAECLKLAREMLLNPHLPANVRECGESNIWWAKSKLEPSNQ
ncbi:MAG: SPBc2 prophage-derived glycosyltransferase SunS [Chlamydiae bacterium]|nr:SPBc2 prophage-derived glycosyltransferase SunS [Chlamydiota bacterium]